MHVLCRIIYRGSIVFLCSAPFHQSPISRSYIYDWPAFSAGGDIDDDILDWGSTKAPLGSHLPGCQMTMIHTPITTDVNPSMPKNTSCELRYPNTPWEVSARRNVVRRKTKRLVDPRAKMNGAFWVDAE